MTCYRLTLRLFAATVFVAPLSAFGQQQHDYAENEMPCGIRCALGAIALTSENGAFPRIDPISLQDLPKKGFSLLDVKQFLRDHKMAGKAYSDVTLASLEPSPEQPVIIQLSAEWLDHTLEPRQGQGIPIERDSDTLPHFVLTVDRDGDQFLVWDVSVGHEYVPLADLEPYFTGNAMEVHQRPQLFNGYFEKNPTTAYLIGGAIAALCGAAILRYRKSRGQTPETTEPAQKPDA